MFRQQGLWTLRTVSTRIQSGEPYISHINRSHRQLSVHRLLNAACRQCCVVVQPVTLPVWGELCLDCFSRSRHLPVNSDRVPKSRRLREPGEIGALPGFSPRPAPLYYAPTLLGGAGLYGTARRCTNGPVLTISLDSGRKKTTRTPGLSIAQPK